MSRSGGGQERCVGKPSPTTAGSEEQRHSLWAFVDEAKFGQQSNESAVLQLAHQFRFERVLGAAKPSR